MQASLWLVLVVFASLCMARPAAAQSPVGALAIDERQGDQWGGAVDYETTVAASDAALRECGPDCAALSECASWGGSGCTVRVWGCNGPVVEEELGLDQTTRRQIQQRLRAEGFDPGGADGLFGPRTRAAIRAWQSSRGVRTTGYLDGAAVEALRRTGGPDSAVAEVAPPSDTVAQQPLPAGAPVAVPAATAELKGPVLAVDHEQRQPGGLRGVPGAVPQRGVSGVGEQPALHLALLVVTALTAVAALFNAVAAKQTAGLARKELELAHRPRLRVEGWEITTTEENNDIILKGVIREVDGKRAWIHSVRTLVVPTGSKWPEWEGNAADNPHYHEMLPSSRQSLPLSRLVHEDKTFPVHDILKLNTTPVPHSEADDLGLVDVIYTFSPDYDPEQKETWGMAFRITKHSKELAIQPCHPRFIRRYERRGYYQRLKDCWWQWTQDLRH